VELDLTAGSLLALYTDGLVENRGEPIDAGLRTLTRLLRRAGGLSLERTGDTLLSALRPEPDDDVALLLVRTQA
jgi:hypothetical protein